MGGAVDGSDGTVKGFGLGAAMSLMTSGADFDCGRCEGSEFVGTVVLLCAASGISVLGDDPSEGNGLTAFTEMPSNIGACFAMSTA